MRIAVASDELRASVWAAGHEPVAVGDAAEAMLLTGPTAWETLRAARVAGTRTGAIVFTPGPPPLDRPLLEPVLLLRDLEQLSVCLEGLGRSVPPGQVRLATGTVDLRQALFHRFDDQTQRLSNLEWRLLAYLAARPGEVVPRDELQLQVWDHSRPVPTRSVDMAISRLRAKIEPDPSDPVSLITSRHVGYRLVVVAEDVDDGLVGRSGVLQALREALDAGVVVVVGPPGIGKSRTAGVAAASIGMPLYVPLAEVRSLDVAVTTLALAAGIPVEAGKARVLLDRILSALPPRQVVVWDDADDVDGLAPLLEASGRPRQIVTRRSGGSDGREVVLEPLSVEQTLRLLEMRTGSATGLQSVAEALDGIPLSIELAAAHLELLGPRGLEHALREPLAVLESQGRSLEAMIRASWGRLSPAAQQLLSRIAWFRGPFTGADALSVSGADTRTWLEVTQAHLVVRDQDRFRLLHAVRSFAFDGSDEEAELSFCRSVVERASPLSVALDGAHGREAHEELRLLVPDLRAVVRRLLRAPSAPVVEERLTSATVALHRELAHHASEGDRAKLLESALARVQDPSRRARLLFERASLRSKADRPSALADYDAVSATATGDLAIRAHLQAAILLVHLGRTPDALVRVESLDPEPADLPTRLRIEHHICKLREVTGATPIGSSLHRMASIADELHALGAMADAVYVAIDVGEWKRAMAHLDTAQHLERVSGWVQRLHAPGKLGQLKISTANALGMVGQTDRALALLNEAQTLFETIQPMRVFHIQTIRAAVLLNAERLDEARDTYLENAAWGRRNAAPYNVLNAALMLCSLEIEAGRIDEAQSWARQAVSLAADAGDHLLAHARLAHAYSCWASGDAATLGTLLPLIAWDDLSFIGQLEWISLAAFVDPTRREQARSLFGEVESPRRGSLQELVVAALARDVEGVDRLFERDRRRFGLDHRILMRIWRGIAEL